MYSNEHLLNVGVVAIEAILAIVMYILLIDNDSRINCIPVKSFRFYSLPHKRIYAPDILKNLTFYVF